MAGYKYRRYKKYRKYKKYYKRYKKAIKPVNSSSRSRVTIKSKALLTFPMIVVHGETDSQVWSFNPFVVHRDPMNVPRTHDVYFGSTIDQPIVSTYCRLYDEFKVDAVVARVTLTTPVGAGATIDALRLYSAWDRKGTYADTYYNSKYPVISDLEAMPSAQVAIVSNNTVNTMYRYCKASDFFEKFCFVDSTCDEYTGKIRIDDDYDDDQVLYCSEAWRDASNNFIGFSPTFYMGIQCVNYVPLNDLVINVAMEMTTYYTFRNPKYGGTGVDAERTKGVAPIPTSLNPNRIGADDVEMVDRWDRDEAPDTPDTPDPTESYAPSNKRVRIVDPEDSTPPPAAVAAADSAGERGPPIPPAPLPPDESFVPDSRSVEQALRRGEWWKTAGMVGGAALLGHAAVNGYGPAAVAGGLYAAGRAVRQRYRNANNVRGFLGIP